MPIRESARGKRRRKYQNCESKIHRSNSKSSMRARYPSVNVLTSATSENVHYTTQEKITQHHPTSRTSMPYARVVCHVKMCKVWFRQTSHAVKTIYMCVDGRRRRKRPVSSKIAPQAIKKPTWGLSLVRTSLPLMLWSVVAKRDMVHQENPLSKAPSGKPPLSDNKHCRQHTN